MPCTRLRFVLVLFLAATAALAQGRGNGGGGEPPTNPEIAFVDGDLEVMSADGSNVATVLDVGRRKSARGPNWSPDGTQIALTGRLGGSFGIYVAATDGSGATRTARKGYDPAWRR